MKRLITIVALSALAILALRICVAGVVYVQSNSMQPIIDKGDGIIINRLAFGLYSPWFEEPVLTWSLPEHGDIVTFRNPYDYGELWLKRVIGLPGDTLLFRNHKLLLNGHIIGNSANREETVITRQGAAKTYRVWSSWLEEDWGPVTVPENSIFVMGDHRGASVDSRVWGPVPIKSLRGKAILRFWPINKIRFLRTL